MNNWLAQFSKNTIATVVILGGIALIIVGQPPHSVCDSQVEVLRESQKKFLYKVVPKSKVLKTSNYEYMYNRCRDNASPGGCYELFQEIKNLLTDLDIVTRECAGTVGGIKEINRALWDTYKLIILLAWGDKPPVAYHSKFAWLDSADISLFCKLKNRLTTMYGEAAVTSFREKMMTDLPGAREITRNQVWDMSLFSENCARYP